MKKFHFNRKIYFSNIIVFSWLLFFTLYLTQQRSFPYLYNDEYGVLGAAAIFSGLEWSAPPGIPFYGFLLSVFSFPMYWLDLEPTMLYRSVLAVNAFFVASSGLLALRTIRILPETHSEILRCGVIIAAFSYPAVLHYSALALGETALLFCFFLMVYHLTVLLHTNQTCICSAILLGVGIGMAQYAHPRGVAFVFAGTIVILYALRVKSISSKEVAITTVIAVSTILFLASLKAHLLETFYIHEHESASLQSFVSSRVSQMSIGGLVKIARVIFGQLTYLLTSTFGLLVIGGAGVIFSTWQEFQRYEFSRVRSNFKKFKPSGILSAFVLLSFILMFIASVLQMSGAARADHYFYGRYNEVLSPALIIAALIFLVNVSKKKSLQLSLASYLVTLLFVLVIGTYPEHIFLKNMYWAPITSWLVYIHGAWVISPKYIFYGILSAFIVLTISLTLSKKLFIFVLVAFFTSVTLHNSEVQHRGADNSWKKFNALANDIGPFMDGMTLQVLEVDWISRLKGEALQFAFPKAHVNFDDTDFRSADAILDYKGKHCEEERTLVYLNKAKFCILNNDLRNKMNFSAAPLDLSSHRARPHFSTHIRVSEELQLNGIKIEGIDRVCAAIANFYYLGWFRHCIPTIDLTISQQGLSGVENHQLGAFISDSKGKWIREWRIKFDNQQLAHDGFANLSSPVPVSLKTHKGVYWLNIAAIDDQGWDWRSTKKIKLTVK